MMKLDSHKVLASICRESFFEFLKEFWDVVVAEPLETNWHMRYICNQLQGLAMRVINGEKREHDLIINIPPGMSKSTIVSQMFCAWVWSIMPSARFICVSYSYNIAMKDSLKTRDLVESEKYKACFPGLDLREDQNTKGMFANAHKGFRMAAGVGGAITGQHGHFLLVDDPLNPQQAYSLAELKNVNRWMRNTLPSRRMPKDVAPIILIQQRLHQSDPTGDMLERRKKFVKHICLPGEMGPNISPPGLRKRYVENDGLLDPKRLSRSVLAEMKDELGLYGYAGQFDQSPVPMEGGCFDAAKLNILPEVSLPIVRMVRSWDKAGTQGAGKFSVGMKLGQDNSGRIWILDVERGQWNATNRERNMQNTADKDGDAVEILIEIEPGSGGKESGEHSANNLKGHRVQLIKPTGDKIVRAYAVSSQVGAGNVFCLQRHWTEALVEEMKYFPAGKYMDQIDALSQGFNYLAKRKKKIGSLWKTGGR